MHKSVLLQEMLQYLVPQDGGTYVDATFGAGGYTKAILEYANCNVIAFDRDPSVTSLADKIQQEFGKRFQFINDKFSTIQNYVKDVNGIVADFGISSMQVDNADRGFSFQKDARLNMQMGLCEISAYDIVNTFSEKDLATIIFANSNERLAYKIANAIYHTRKQKYIETTLELAKIIFEAYGSPQRYKIHPATKTFQAIRVFINDEFNEIKELLVHGSNVLSPNGRFICVAFHEIEDRIVKDYFSSISEKRIKLNKYKNTNPASNSKFTVLTKKPIEPTIAEIARNPRCRSAKLRVLTRNN